MPLSPAVDMKIKVLTAMAGIFFLATPSFAQTTPTPMSTYFPTPTPLMPTGVPVTGNTAYAPAGTIPPQQQAPLDRTAFLQGLQAALQTPPAGINAQLPQQQPAQPQPDLGSITDPNSTAYKAHKLAKDARQQRADTAELSKKDTEDMGLEEDVPPPEIETLQQLSDSSPNAPSIADDPLHKEMALDMRKEAQKEAALSYGARGGLAKRNFQIMERMKGFDAVLDKVFNFRALLIKTASGLLIEPPIVKESQDALVITASGDEAAVADKIFDINKKADIVSAPRDWRQYLVQTWSEVPPPPRVLWPKTKQEQADWSTWVEAGWKAGEEQAEQIFESNVNRLVADYNGMVRYRMLLAQGMISAPYAMHEDRGVTGDKNQMRVGDRAIRITGPSQFLTGAELWKPADR